MDNIKYVILDMGKVLVEPTTGSWYITPVFLENVDIKKIDIEALRAAMKQFGPLLDSKMETLDEEYNMLYEFYKKALSMVGYEIPEQNLKKIVDDFVYNVTDSKYYMYDDVKTQLEILSKKYKVFLLSDNWPCSIEYLKKHDIYKYFTKVYISSIYAERKQDRVLFDRPINDFNIKSGEALFVDDNEKLLDIAVEKNLNVVLMDRSGQQKESKYRTINSLMELEKIL